MASFLANKGWKAQEYYNEYLNLKAVLVELTQTIAFRESCGVGSDELETEVTILTDRLHSVLNNLKLEGVTMESLVYLSCGLDAHHWQTLTH